MGDAVLTYNIEVEKSTQKNFYEGNLTITSSEDLTIDLIKGFVDLEGRGKMNSFKEKLVTFNIETQQLNLTKGTQIIPFSFELPENTIDAYEGKSATISYKCGAIFYVNENDLDKLNTSTFSKIKSLLSTDKSITTPTYSFNKPIIPITYKIQEQKTQLELKGSSATLFTSVFIVGFIYMVLYAIFKFDPNFAHIFFILIPGGLLATIIHKSKENNMGDVFLNTFEKENGFSCEINTQKKIKLNNIIVYYIINEKVVDNRGTSDYTHTETLYKSPTQKLTKLENVSIEFDFPDNKNLYTFKYKDVSIEWELTIEGTNSNGVDESLTCNLLLD